MIQRFWFGAALVGAALSTADIGAQVPAQWGEYWYRGEAELNRFELEQNRYGEMRRGEAVLIFVTEDFLAETQVKDDGLPRESAESSVKVLKLNAIRRFQTGVYDYSLMRSVFSPVAEPRALKVTASIQDWCGHVWLQLNRTEAGYRGTGHSYFQSEGDETFDVSAPLLEDELMTRLRLDPEALPTGKCEVLPGVFHSRLAHKPLAPMAAVATRRSGGEGLMTYELRFDGGRHVAITYDKAFPHRIESWTEGDGDDVHVRARRTHIEMLDYWNHSKNDDAALRRQLGLRERR